MRMVKTLMDAFGNKVFNKGELVFFYRHTPYVVYEINSDLGVRIASERSIDRGWLRFGGDFDMAKIILRKKLNGNRIVIHATG